ncbi:MAG: hypothetical protein ACKO0W_12780 [Planctomycetota bacterium]
MPPARGSSISNTESNTESTASRVRRAVTRAGARDRAWRIRDFSDMPALAVAQALSRLAREGVIVRVSKGVYAVKGCAAGRVRIYEARAQAPLFPCSVTAANALRLSLQCPRRAWYSTPASYVPAGLEGGASKVVTRRPGSWRALEPLDGALLEVLRDGCIHSQLEPEATVRALRAALRAKGRLQRIMSVVAEEPPRVRAMLGALLEQRNRRRPPAVHAAIGVLRESLNPLSRYRFGQLSLMPEAPRWQALEPRAIDPEADQ